MLNLSPESDLNYPFSRYYIFVSNVRIIGMILSDERWRKGFSRRWIQDPGVEANAVEGWMSGRDPTASVLTFRGLEEWKRPWREALTHEPLYRWNGE